MHQCIVPNCPLCEGQTWTVTNRVGPHKWDHVTVKAQNREEAIQIAQDTLGGTNVACYASFFGVAEWR